MQQYPFLKIIFLCYVFYYLTLFYIIARQEKRQHETKTNKQSGGRDRKRGRNTEEMNDELKFLY